MHLCISLSIFIVCLFSNFYYCTKRTMFNKCSNWLEHRATSSQKRDVRAIYAGGLLRGVPLARRAIVAPVGISDQRLSWMALMVFFRMMSCVRALFGLSSPIFWRSRSDAALEKAKQSPISFWSHIHLPLMHSSACSRCQTGHQDDSHWFPGIGELVISASHYVAAS